MNTIFKYPIKIIDKQELKIPYDCEILHVGLDSKGVPCLWAKVNDANVVEPVTVHIVGTGKPIPRHACRHIGTFNLGSLVWHVFLDAL